MSAPAVRFVVLEYKHARARWSHKLDIAGVRRALREALDRWPGVEITVKEDRRASR